MVKHLREGNAALAVTRRLPANTHAEATQLRLERTSEELTEVRSRLGKAHLKAEKAPVSSIPPSHPSDLLAPLLQGLASPRTSSAAPLDTLPRHTAERPGAWRGRVRQHVGGGCPPVGASRMLQGVFRGCTPEVLALQCCIS